jgi:hypothetical protein
MRGDEMKKIIALCLIVCLSLSLSPFSSVATAEWNWGIIRFVSGVVVLGLTSYALKGYGILKDEDPEEEVYRREKRESERAIQEVRDWVMLHIVEEREEAIRAAGVPNNPAGPLPVNRVDAYNEVHAAIASAACGGLDALRPGRFYRAIR